jgi:hypothetical protein
VKKTFKFKTKNRTHSMGKHKKKFSTSAYLFLNSVAFFMSLWREIALCQSSNQLELWVPCDSGSWYIFLFLSPSATKSCSVLGEFLFSESGRGAGRLGGRRMYRGINKSSVTIAGSAGGGGAGGGTILTLSLLSGVVSDSGLETNGTGAIIGLSLRGTEGVCGVETLLLDSGLETGATGAIIGLCSGG